MTATETRQGIGVSPGSAYGPVVQVAPPVRPPANKPAVDDREAALGDVRAAFESVAVALEGKGTPRGSPSIKLHVEALRFVIERLAAATSPVPIHPAWRRIHIAVFQRGSSRCREWVTPRRCAAVSFSCQVAN